MSDKKQPTLAEMKAFMQKAEVPDATKKSIKDLLFFELFELIKGIWYLNNFSLK